MLADADRAIGCLLGGALGDSLLLPEEGLDRERIARRGAGPLRQGLVAGRGLLSDDTEHAFLTAQALSIRPPSPDRSGGTTFVFSNAPPGWKTPAGSRWF